MGKVTRPIPVIILFSGLIMAHAVSADNFEPEGIRTGSIIHYPYAGVTFGHDDNVLSQETNETESFFTILSAGVNLQLLPDNSSGVFEFLADIEDKTYKSSEDDDYTDTRLAIGYIHQPNDKLRMSAFAEIAELHDERTPRTLASRPSLDVYTDTSFGGDWYYGVNNFEGADYLVTFNQTDRYYDSNRDVNAFNDRTSTEISGLMRFPVKPNTRLRVSGRLIEFDYDTADVRDNTELRFLIGADWQVSDISFLLAEVGQQAKDFDENVIDDDTESEPAWEIAYTWQPEEFNLLVISTSQDFAESNTGGAFTKNRTTEVTWNVAWEDYFRTTFTVGNREETYIRVGPDSVDDIDYLLLDLRYALRKTIQLTGSIASRDISSSIPGYSSDRAVISVGVVAAF
jgi:hypothetical protein